MRRNHVVQKDRSCQHREANAATDDHPGADQEHARLERKAGHLSSRDWTKPSRSVDLFGNQKITLGFFQPNLWPASQPQLFGQSAETPQQSYDSASGQSD